MATPNVPAQAAPRMTPQQQDAIATRAILAAAVDRIQLVTAEQVSPASNPVLIVQPINVGLVKRFTIIVEGVITNSGTVPVNLTDFGLANLFGQGGIQYTDLNNYLRVNTSGQHLTLLAQAKRRRAYGSTVDDYTGNTFLPNNLSKMTAVPPALWPVFTAQQTIAAGTSGNFRGVFELPLSYTDDDLRGAVWANVLNAVQQITLTLNQNIVVAAPNDFTFAVYAGAAGAAGSITSAKITIYQEYLDQLPKAQGSQGVTTILPALSLSTVYELKSTIFSSITPNQEFYIPYANQRSFISTLAVFYDGTSRSNGADVNYWALLAANASYIWKLDPLTVTMKSRDHMNSDLPSGTYYFPSRRKNIATLQYGNLQLTLNANSSTAAAYINVMWEAFALQNTLQSGASLASGG